MSTQNTSGLIISESDYEKLSHLVEISRSTATAALDKELLLADVCPDDQMPDNIVSMYGKTFFKDVNTENVREVTIVMPWESNVTEMRISILSPVGTAIIGACVGAIIDWPLLHGKSTKLEIVAVTRPFLEIANA